MLASRGWAKWLTAMVDGKTTQKKLPEIQFHENPIPGLWRRSEHRDHRVVDATLLCTPGIVANRSGMFFMKTVLSGKSRDMLRAYKTIQREATR